MNPKILKVVLGLVVLGLVVAGAVKFPEASAGSGDGTQALVGAPLELADVENFDGYELLWVGESFEELPLTGIIRDLEPRVHPEPRGSDLVTFLYGDCDASAGACPYPLAIQVWPACLRNRASYEIAPGEPYPYEPLVIRGVPAGAYDDGTRLEVYTGGVTVVVFGDSPGRLRRAAEGLYVANPTDSGAGAELAAAGAGADLPAPPPGALEGELRCMDS